MTRVGGTAKAGGRTGRRTTADEAAKKAKTRSRTYAVSDRHPDVPRSRQNHLIPQRVLDIEVDEVEYIGQLLAGIEDFKVLRGSVAVVNLTTSTEFAHLLTDAALISRGNVLVVQLYQVKRSYLFDDDEDDTDGD